MPWWMFAENWVVTCLNQMWEKPEGAELVSVGQVTSCGRSLTQQLLGRTCPLKYIPCKAKMLNYLLLPHVLTPISKDDGVSVSQEEVEVVGDWWFVPPICFHSPRGAASHSDPILSGLQLPSVNCQCLYQIGRVQLVSCQGQPSPCLAREKLQHLFSEWFKGLFDRRPSSYSCGFPSSWWGYKGSIPTENQQCK